MANLSLDGNLIAGGNLGTSSSTVTSTLSTLNNGVVTTSTTKALIVTTESLTTATQVIYTSTITNTTVTIGDIVFAQMTKNGTNTQGSPLILDATATAGALVVRIVNQAVTGVTTVPLSGTLQFQVLVLKA